MNLKNDVTILCSTHDSFNDMWDNFLLLFSKYWPDHPELVFASNSKSDYYDGYKFFNSLGDFSDRLIFALSRINTNYILLTLDDYFLFEKINPHEIYNLVKYLENNNGSYMKIYKSKFGKQIDKFNKIRILPLQEPYEISFTPGLWKRTDLLKCLLQGKSPWESEVLLTKQAKKNGLIAFSCSKKHVFDYVDIVRKGKYLRKGVRFLKRKGLYISERLVMPLSESIARGGKAVLSNVLPRTCKKTISKLFKLNTFSNYFYEEN